MKDTVIVSYGSEMTCQCCGGPNISWSVDSSLWNAVCKKLEAVVCPPCFVKMWEEFDGTSPHWILAIETKTLDSNHWAVVKKHSLCP